MPGPNILDRLQKKFGAKISGSKLQALDPWIEVTPAGLVEVCQYLKTEPDLKFELLNCITAVDYFERRRVNSHSLAHRDYYRGFHHSCELLQQHGVRCGFRDRSDLFVEL